MRTDEPVDRALGIYLTKRQTATLNRSGASTQAMIEVEMLQLTASSICGCCSAWRPSAIPPIIHLLNRRRFEVVDWGAMQFLQVSEATRRRLLIEELLLMLLRMGLIAVLVLALAGAVPHQFADRPAGPRPNRDVVLVFDGSYSMGSTGKEVRRTTRPRSGRKHSSRT